MEITNKKHRAFADEYLTNGMNATKAYMTVYKSAKKTTAETNSLKLLQKTAIKGYIQTAQDKSSKKLEITREELLKDLQDIKNTCKGEYPPHALKAIEIINKMLGFNAADKQEITIKEQPLFGEEDDE